MDALKAKISEAREQLKALKAGEQTLENAQKIQALRAQIAVDQAELDTLTEAFEKDSDIDTEPVATKIDEVEPGKDANDVQPGGADVDKPATATPSPVAPAPAPAPATTPTTPTEGEDGEGEDGGEGDEATAPVTLAASAADVSPTAHVDDRELRAMTLTASGSAAAAGLTPGAQLDRSGVGRVLQAAASAAGVVTGKTRILEIGRWGDDADVIGEHNTPIENSRKIAEARARHLQGKENRPVALTAAGCFCGPDELIRETGVVGRRGRPFAALFPSIPINGGFRAMPDLAFNVDTGLRSGVSQWTCADQDAVDADDPTTWKPCAEIECFTEETYVPYAVEACVTVERFHRWAHPEQVDAWINLLGIEYDSLAETLLIDKVETDAGTPLTIGAAGGLMEEHGLLAKLIYALGSLSFSLGYQFREGEGVLEGYTLSVPVGMAEAVLADEQIRGFPSNIRTKQELLSRLEQSYGVRMVERLDESTSRKAAAIATVTALNAGGAIDDNATPLLPPTFRMYLIPTGGYVHAEGTLVGADWHVDDALLRQNRMRYFLENLELLENLSVRKPHIIDVPGVILGSYSDLVAPPQPV